jgi:hypothetical protein
MFKVQKQRTGISPLSRKAKASSHHLSKHVESLESLAILCYITYLQNKDVAEYFGYEFDETFQLRLPSRSNSSISVFENEEKIVIAFRGTRG